MTTIRITEKNFNQSVLNCVEYASNATTKEEMSGYLADICDVLRIKEQSGFRLAFYTLTSKGVFHDCEGKVTEVKGDEIAIETEY